MYRRRRQIGASGIYSSCWTFTVVCRYLLKSNALKCILFWLLRNSTNNGNLNYFHNYSSTLRSGSVKSELPFKVDWKWSVEKRYIWRHNDVKFFSTLSYKNCCRCSTKRNSNLSIFLCGLKKSNIFGVLIWFYFCCGRNENIITIATFQNITSIVVKMLFKNSRLSFLLCQLQLMTWKMSNSADSTLIYSRSLHSM